MAAAGRVLQVIGWIWVALGFFGPFLNLPLDVNLFPGIILVFVARVLRAQAARNAPVEYEAPAPEPERAEPRILNTERSRAPEPVVKPEPVAKSEPVVEREPKPRPSSARSAAGTTRSESEPERVELEEKLLFAGMELAGKAESEPMSAGEVAELGESTRPLSSAEMIAEAHKRWNKRP
ncbi:MAG: hypothetical protein PVF87_02450 [Acidimicrobiia bacterium]|jgi:hypothetical protein